MAFKMFWDNHLLFTTLPKNVQEEDSKDAAIMLNPYYGTLVNDINSTQQTIEITPNIVLPLEGFIHIGSDDVGVEQIYYNYDSSNPYYLTNCVRDYDSKGSFSHSSEDYLYVLPKKEGQLSRFLRTIESSFDSIYKKTIDLPNLKNPQTCISDLLIYLSTERGWADLDLTKSEAYQRKFIDFLPDIYRNKGTKAGLIDLIYLITSIKGSVFNYWDFSLFIEQLYGHPSYISLYSITSDPDNERIYQVRVPSLNADYNEIRKVIRYSRPSCQNCEIVWTSFFDDFSIELPYWSLGSESKKTLTSDNTLVLERGVE